jgi:hypothetical protein
MKTSIEYIIVAMPFHADAATHDELARKVNEKLIGVPRCCPAASTVGLHPIAKPLAPAQI